MFVAYIQYITDYMIVFDKMNIFFLNFKDDFLLFSPYCVCCSLIERQVGIFFSFAI